jgi:hypothetical protein
MEALDPVQLRALVADAIDAVIDTKVLKRVIAEEAAERRRLDRSLRGLAKTFGDAKADGTE